MDKKQMDDEKWEKRASEVFSVEVEESLLEVQVPKKFYTSSRHASLVNLTDDEIDAIGMSKWVGYPSYNDEFRRIARAVIQAYKRKNGLK